MIHDPFCRSMSLFCNYEYRTSDLNVPNAFAYTRNESVAPKSRFASDCGCYVIDPKWAKAARQQLVELKHWTLLVPFEFRSSEKYDSLYACTENRSTCACQPGAIKITISTGLIASNASLDIYYVLYRQQNVLQILNIRCWRNPSDFRFYLLSVKRNILCVVLSIKLMQTWYKKVLHRGWFIYDGK